MSGDSGKRTAVLLDPHPLWLDAVEMVLARTGVEVVGATTAGADALALLDEHRPHLFVAETDIPGDGMNGLACIQKARKRSPTTKVIVLSSGTASESVQAAFAAGATAYVAKTARADDVASAIRQTFDHSVYFAAEFAAHAANGRSARGNGGSADGEAPEIDSLLTKREREILRLVSEGRSNAEIARTLWVTEQTVKFHLSNIYRKLGVSNRTQASRWAQLHGVLSLPSRPRTDASTAA